MEQWGRIFSAQVRKTLAEGIAFPDGAGFMFDGEWELASFGL
jgi:hypothetical protein